MSNTTIIAQTATQASAVPLRAVRDHVTARVVWNAPTVSAVNRATASALLRALEPWGARGHRERAATIATCLRNGCRDCLAA